MKKLVILAQLAFLYSFYAIKRDIMIAWKEGFFFFFLWSTAEEKDLELLIYCLSA